LQPVAVAVVVSTLEVEVEQAGYYKVRHFR
jgi:hypothetical protein